MSINTFAKKIYVAIINTIGVWDDVAYRAAEEPLNYREFMSAREEELHSVDVQLRMYINKNPLITEEEIERCADRLELAICTARMGL